jgi:transcriptional regulator with XRE-family HTH domain
MDPSTVSDQWDGQRRNAQTIIQSALAEQRAESAKRLGQALGASGKSYETVAHEAGVSTKTISRWVNRRHDPTRDTVEGVAEALGVDPDWLWPPPKPLDISTAAEQDARLDELAQQFDRIEHKLDALLTAMEITQAFGDDDADSQAAPESGRAPGRRHRAA